MTARDKLGLLGMGLGAALASAAAVHVFVAVPGTSSVEIAASQPAHSTTRSARLETALAEPEADQRLAYAPGEDVLRASYEPEASAGENPDGWNSETLTDAALPIDTEPAPQDWHTDVARPAAPVTAAKPEPLPWKSATPPTSANPKGPSLPEASLKERLAQITPAAMTRIKEKFSSANAAWPPAEIALIAVKEKKTLELHARPKGGTWQHVHSYPVLAASGQPGPKLKQGDKQVPEGIYNVSFLNPNSRYHVSMRLNYPNDFDRQMAAKDGRKELGGDIMIHGKAVSIGCLAVGDVAAEELFVLAAETGLPNVKVIIAPADFRRDAVPERQPGQPEWLPKLYTQVASAMSEFPKPPSSGLLSFFGN